MDMYHKEFSSNDLIPESIKPRTETLSASHLNKAPMETAPPHPDVVNDLFLAEFLKHLPESSRPMAGCKLKGINLNDPDNLITVMLDFSLGDISG